MRCPVCQNFLPPDSKFCPFCGQTIAAPEAAPKKSSAGLSAGALWIVFGALLLLALLSCLLLLTRGALPLPESAAGPDLPSDTALSGNVYYIPEMDVDAAESQESMEAPKPGKKPPMAGKDQSAAGSPLSEKEAAPPNAEPEEAPGEAPHQESPAVEEKPLHTISVSPMQASIRVGESLSFHVSHNYPGAQVYLSADNFDETTALYSQSFQWDTLSADFTITALAPGPVLISFFYENAEHVFIRSEQVSVTILEAEGALDPEVQQVLDLLQEQLNPEATDPTAEPQSGESVPE